MKPEDVPDDLMSKGRGAFAEFLSKADPRRITPLSGQVNAILAAVLPAHERQVRERVAEQIEAERSGPVWDETDTSGDSQHWDKAMDHAARIARGES